jgi:CheY-like chemotaxis protein
MPEMDGLALIFKIKSIAPDTVRIVLTGQASVHTAIAAINDGDIFRFLTKPCNKETMKKSLLAGLAQARLNVSEKEILGETLTACIQVVTEVLSLVNPAAFSRAMRLRRYMVHVVHVLGLANPWMFEVAALMSQLGCVSVAPEIIQAVHTWQTLSDEERIRYEQHPIVTQRLLENIPRMRQIAWIIANQNNYPPTAADSAGLETAEIRTGAEILHVALAFDELVQKGESRGTTWTALNRRFKDLNTKILDALLETEQDSEDMQVRTCTIADLSPGMTLREDIYSVRGSLLAAKGQGVTIPVILKLKNFRDSGALADAFQISEANPKAKTSSNATLSVPSPEQLAARV